MKNKIIIASLLIGSWTYGQVQVQNKPTTTIGDTNPFLDASNFNKFDNNIGKGLYFPSVDLKIWEFKTASIDPETFSTYFDGMVVYNTGEGDATTSADVGGIRKNLTRGFYYFKNPNQNFPNGSVSNGEWVRLGDADIANLYTQDGTLTSNREVDLDNKKLVFVNGKIGVENQNPQETLDVNGTVRVSQLPENTTADKVLVVGQNNRIEKRDLNATSGSGVIGGRMGTLQYTVGKTYECNSNYDPGRKNRGVKIWAIDGVVECKTMTGDSGYHYWYWSGEVGDGYGKTYSTNIKIGNQFESGLVYAGNRYRDNGFFRPNRPYITTPPIRVVDDSQYQP